jgi:fido (protein-threonine AMPylation protein)
MTPKKNLQQPLDFKQLKKLRTALAISQGSKLLSTLREESEATVSHDQSKRVTYLTKLFSRIHREIFHDWKKQATVDHRPGVMPSASRRKEFRLTIEKLVLDDSNKESAIFDNNGFVIKTDNIANRLADFYHAMRRVRPFSYGNSITLDFFMTAQGNYLHSRLFTSIVLISGDWIKMIRSHYMIPIVVFDQ